MTQVVVGEPADQRADHESDPERGPDETHAAGPLRRRCDVGHVRLRRRDVAARQPGDHARDEQDRVRRREREQDVAQGVDDHRGEQNRSAADPIRQPAELRSRVPCALKLDRWSVALFFHDGQFRAIGNTCNHKGGPLSEGRLHGEFVMCPWHAWEYSVITGKGPAGYDEEQVPVFAVEERPDGVYVQTPPVLPRKLVKHKPSHLLEPHVKPAGAPPRVLLISTTAMDDVNPRFSTSDALLEHALDKAKRRGAETQHVKLRDLKFRHCEGNYSKAAHACTWPCAITERDPEDQLTA